VIQVKKQSLNLAIRNPKLFAMLHFQEKKPAFVVDLTLKNNGWPCYIRKLGEKEQVSLD
jgi:hypothetical protein